MRRVVAAGLAIVAGAGAALAGDASLSVKRLGSVKVRWNSVGYRDELMAQLAPGLTWRLGKDGATRLAVEKMALVGAQGAVLLPGEQTLNLRYWAADHWELVVFEEDDWKWSEDKTQLGTFHARVGQEKDEKRHAKALDLAFRETTRGDPTGVGEAAVTGRDADSELLDLFAVPDDVQYTPESRTRWEALPWLELVMRFGPHVGVVGFEPVRTRELMGRLGASGEEPRDVRVTAFDLPEPGVRSEFLEQHEGEIPVGVLFGGASDAKGGVVLYVSGGDAPFLSGRTRDGQETDLMLEGTRAEARLEKSPNSTFAALDGSRLTVTVAPFTYTFDLGGGE